jgi:cell wall assembly regulator SMI1
MRTKSLPSADERRSDVTPYMTMSGEIEQSWARVTRWLAAHAPASYATLRPPAAPTEIESCERELGMTLPADLKWLLLTSNGAADFDADGTCCRGAAFMPGNHRLLPSAEIASQSQSLIEIAAGLGDHMIGWWWHPQWVLFAMHIAANGLAIDQRPGHGQGSVGQFMHEDHTSFDMAPSLGAFIAKMADSLDNGTDFLYYRPTVEDGCLDWHVVLSR